MDSVTHSIIPLVPECPEDVIRASENGELAIFIGAGVSRLIGCKGWNELANDLVRACVFEGCIAFHQMNNISKYDPKKIISICRSLLKGIGRLDAYYEAIAMSLRADSYLSKKFPVYPKLAELKALFVTTNMDEHFDQEFVAEKIYFPSRLHKGVLNQQSLYHIHGSIQIPASMIFTTEDYLQRYRDQSYIDFLNELFATHTVLFVGYGLTELEVLDYLFVKAQSERTHHLLLGLHSNQTEELQFERAYYQAFRIEVHPFQLDKLGHHQLYHVIDSWCDTLKSKTNLYAAGFNFIDRYTDTFNIENVPHVLQLLRSDVAFQEHFFKKVTALEWFEPLLAEGYFEPEKNLPPTPAEKEGYYTIPNWRALNYLVVIASKIADGGETSIGESITTIVRRVSENMQGDKLNPTTAWRFVEIMGRIPTSLVLPSDFQLVSQYLSSPSTNSLISGEVAQRLFPHFVLNGTPEQLITLWTVVVGQKYKDPADVNSAKVPLMEEHWLEQLIRANLNTLSNRCAQQAWDVVFNLLKDITGVHEYSFDFMWIRDLNALSFKHDYQEAILIAARALLTAAVQQDVQQAKLLLLGLFAESHPIFKRLAIATINELWAYKSLQRLFWSFVNCEVLSQTELVPELVHLFEQHFGSFSAARKKRFLQWVIDGPTWGGTTDDDTDPWKLGWLNAVQKYSSKAHHLHQTIYERMQVRHPEWFRKLPSEKTEVQHWTSSDILALSIPELVHTLQTHKKEAGLMPNRFYNDSLTNAVFAAVKQQPNKYLDDWSPLVSVPNPYLHTFVQGFLAAVKDNQTLTLIRIVRLCIAIVSKFSVSSTEPESASLLQGLIPDMLNLVCQFMIPNSSVHPAEDLVATETLLRNIRTLIQDSEQLSKHSYTESTFVRTWLEYALRCARQNESRGPVHWTPTVRDMVTNFVADGLSADGWSQIGTYLPQLAWLDKDWLRANLTRLFPDAHEEVWTATMDGYLYSNVYEEVYEMLCSSGIYVKALEHPTESSWRQRLIHHIGAAYLAGWDTLDNPGSVTSLCIEKWGLDDMNHLVNFFWVVASHPLEADLPVYRGRIRAFWQRVHGRMSVPNSLHRPSAELCQQLVHLVTYFDQIDPELQDWILFCTLHMDHVSGIFVEELDRICETNTAAVGTIFLEMTRRLLPDYDKAHIISIVEKLFINGEKDTATLICTTYFSHGIEFLRDVFGEYYTTPLHE